MNNISIIIPLYNATEYITRCISSIINQVDINDEIIIIDDGSTDDSFEKCKIYEKKYHNIKLIQQENRGAGEARNCGIRNAVNEWIVFIDADDFADISMNENIRKYVSREFDIVFFEHINEDRVNHLALSIEQVYFNEANREELIRACFIESNANIGQIDLRSIWGNVYKKKFLVDNEIFFDRKLVIGEDMIFLLKAYSKISNAKFVSIPIYHYFFQNEGSITNKYKPNFIDDVELFDKKMCNLFLNNDKYWDWYAFYRLNDIILFLKYTIFNIQNKNKFCDKKKYALKVLESGNYKNYFIQARNSGLLKNYSLSKRITFWLAINKKIELLFVIYKIRYIK